MTQDEIIEMADKADVEADNVLNMKGEYHPNWHEVRDEIFAKLVAAKEREACAKVVDDWSDWHGGTELIAAAIRARTGEEK
jgi:hypothetical protein